MNFSLEQLIPNPLFRVSQGKSLLHFADGFETQPPAKPYGPLQSGLLLGKKIKNTSIFLIIKFFNKKSIFFLEFIQNFETNITIILYRDFLYDLKKKGVIL